MFAYPVRFGTHGYDDANRIKAYNGAAVYFAYIVIPADGSTAYWVTEDDRIRGKNGNLIPSNYVPRVCGASML